MVNTTEQKTNKNIADALYTIKLLAILITCDIFDKIMRTVFQFCLFIYID